MVTDAAPPNARLYANCLGQAAEAGVYARARDNGAEMILFTCTGQPARAFFDRLASRSAEVGSEYRSLGRTYRSTNAVQKNLFGVDYCSHGDEEDYNCVIALNTGAFLSAP